MLDAHPLDIVEPWRELEEAQLLGHGRFSHDLIAETVLGACRRASRRRCTRGWRRARALGRGAGAGGAALGRGAGWRRAGETYAAAARDARRASRRSDEMALWEHAADSFDRAGQPGKAFDARADSVECVILVRGIEAAGARVDRLDADQRTEPQRMRALTSRACVA